MKWHNRSLIYSYGCLLTGSFLLLMVSPSYGETKVLMRDNFNSPESSSLIPNSSIFLVAQGENTEEVESNEQEEEEIFSCLEGSEQQISQSDPLEITVGGLMVQVIGSSIFTANDLESELNTLLNSQNFSREDLPSIANGITQLYLNQGYLTSRAIVREDNFNSSNRLPQIIVIEGILTEINLANGGRLTKYVCARLKEEEEQPFNASDLEDRLRLLDADPLIDNIEASLRAGESQGESILDIRVTEAKNFQGNVGLDNYSPPSVGPTRANLQVGYQNLTGIGDRFAIIYQPRLENFADTYQLDFNYLAPISRDNATIQLRALIDRNEIITGDFEDLDISSESEFYQISYRQPIIRNPRRELALSLGMTYRDGQTFTFIGPTPFGIGPDDDGISRTNVLQFGQEYVIRQSRGAWGFRSQFNVGIGIFDVTENEDDIPDGHFFSWLGQIQRIQVLNDSNLLVMQADIQLTTDPLLPSEQFTIGGGQSVRGFRQNVRTADNGVRASIEDRITLVRNEQEEPLLILAPYFDMGYIWNNADNPNFLPEQQFIAGLGLGLSIQPWEGLSIRVDYSPPLIDLDDRGDNVQDDGLHFRINYDF